MKNILLSILMLMSVSLFAFESAQKGRITKVDERNSTFVTKGGKGKSNVGAEIIFFALEQKEPSVYKEYLKIKEVYNKTYEDEETIILMQKYAVRYVNYYIINKKTGKFMFVESQADDKDLSNSIYWGDFQ